MLMQTVVRGHNISTAVGKLAKMSWPTPQDYNEAIQNPTSAFSDRELRHGKPQLTALGLPRPMSGQFASVYRLYCAKKDWAVRCFLHNIPGQQKHYETISQFVCNDDLEYTVGFEYLSKGIQVHQHWYPILKMEWVDGETLFAFIEANLTASDKIYQLAESFRIMTRRLASAGIAHGDLQHGNILVVEDDLRLVDYDGMYVPALGVTQSNELGHRNYQHPGRTRDHFGAYIDNFSAWLIYLSLQFIARDWRLWHDLQGGDECLLFRQADFLAPDKSKTFQTLLHHQTAEIRNGAHVLQAMLEIDPTYIQPLDDVDQSLCLPNIHRPSWFVWAAYNASRWTKEHIHLFEHPEKPAQQSSVALAHAIPQAMPANRQSPPAVSPQPAACTAPEGLPDWMKTAMAVHRSTALLHTRPKDSARPGWDPALDHNLLEADKKARKLLRSAKTALRKQRFDPGIHMARNGLALISNLDVRLQLELFHVLVKLYLRKGEKLMDNYRWTEAIGTYECAIKVLEQMQAARNGFMDKTVNMLMCDSYEQLSRCYEEERSTDDAKRALEHALRLIRVYPQHHDRQSLMELRLTRLKIKT